jgi:hypothetical protein
MKELILKTDWREKYLGGSESVEAEQIRRFAEDIHSVQLDNQQASHWPVVSRAFHAKNHAGITNARLRIVPEIPVPLQIGYFQAGREYPALVRFSNASGTVQPDPKKDLRGIAVQIRPGSETHELMMTNAASSHARNAGQFMDFATAMAGSKLLILPRLVFGVGPFETVRMLLKVVRQVSKPVPSLCTEQFWSRAPYKMGPYAVKLTLVPVLRSTESGPGSSPNYLGDDLVNRLKQGEVVYQLKVQLWLDENRTPIEDGSVEWKEVDSPPVTIAELILPRQDLTTRAAESERQKVDLMQFNPWNTTDDFRPLGSLNRARKLVYRSSGTYRAP